MQWGFVFGNPQLRQIRKNTQLDYNSKDKTIVYPQSYEGTLSSKINYRLIQYILSFLELRDLIQAKLTCSLFNRIIRFQILEQVYTLKESIYFNGTKEIMIINLDQYSQFQLAGMRILINTQDIGSYPGGNCTSYFTLKLIKGNQQNSLEQEPQQTLEVDLLYNFNELKVKKKDLYITFRQQGKDDLNLFMRQINRSDYNTLSLNVKGTLNMSNLLFIFMIIYEYNNPIQLQILKQYFLKLYICTFSLFQIFLIKIMFQNCEENEKQKIIQVTNRKSMHKSLKAQFQQSECIKAQDNQQQQNLNNVPNFVKDIQGLQIYPQTQYEGNLQGTVNYHLIKIIFSYLIGVELVQAKQSCQYFNILIKFKSQKEQKKEEIRVQNDRLQKYLEVDLNLLKEQNLLAIKVVVSSKDYGYAGASYS
ncbi:hypothetical protein pb186bvf_004642 [Paramecium bursaria]